MIGRDFDVGRVVKSPLHSSVKKLAQTKVVAHTFHEGDDTFHVSLQLANGVIKMLETLAVALENVVIERDLLFDAGNDGNCITLLTAWRLDMLIVWCSRERQART